MALASTAYLETSVIRAPVCWWKLRLAYRINSNSSFLLTAVGDGAKLFGGPPLRSVWHSLSKFPPNFPQKKANNRTYHPLQKASKLRRLQYLALYAALVGVGLVVTAGQAMLTKHRMAKDVPPFHTIELSPNVRRIGVSANGHHALPAAQRSAMKDT